MVLTVAALAAGLAAGVAGGGSLGAVGRRRLRLWWLLIPGFGLEALADRLGAPVAAQVAAVTGYACLLAFVVANRLLVGTGVIATGLLLNAAVVSVDGGMPVRPAAVVAAGLARPGLPVPPPAGHRHHLERPGDRFTVLDDREAFLPLHRVFSVGDLVLAVGVADAAAHLVLPATARARRRRRAARWALVRRGGATLGGWLVGLVVQPAVMDATRVGPHFYGLGRNRLRGRRPRPAGGAAAGRPGAGAGDRSPGAAGAAAPGRPTVGTSPGG